MEKEGNLVNGSKKSFNFLNFAEEQISILEDLLQRKLTSNEITKLIEQARIYLIKIEKNNLEK